ncbi:MAG: FHA domain-containing protein [Planctomycetia bacterium]|nr:FHA domain-containing protein [Planctomycetia bacterium]
MVRIEVLESGQSTAMVLDRQVIRIGRESDNDVVLADEKASRHHCELKLQPNGIMIRDLSSRNGTFFGNERITQLLLSKNGSITIGKAKIRLNIDSQRFSSASPPPSPADISEIVAVSSGNSGRPDDKHWARVAMDAASDYSLAGGKREKTDWVERLFYRQWLAKVVISSIVVVVLIGASIWYVVSSRAERKALAEQKVRENASLVSDARTKVEELLQKSKPGEAAQAVRQAQLAGLEISVVTELEAAIAKGAEGLRSEILAKAKLELESGGLKKVEELLRDARALNEFVQDTRQVEKLEKRLAEAREAAEYAPAMALFAKARQSLSSGDFEGALQNYELARNRPHKGPEIDEFGNELREKIGGRLRIIGLPPEGIVRFAGLPPAGPSEVVSGLKSGLVEFTVEARGFLPESLSAHVNFPEITEQVVSLVPEASEPLWAMNVLQGHCAQRLVEVYYKQVLKDEDEKGKIDALKSQCNADINSMDFSQDPESPFKKSLQRAITRLTKLKNGQFILALDDLGTLAESTSDKGRAAIIRESASELKPYINRIERGCSQCWGQGAVPCARCMGIGKSKESRVCKSCDGQGQKTHTTCKGTGFQECKPCNGKGVKARWVSGGGQGATSAKRRVETECKTCHGEGRIGVMVKFR